MTTNILLNSDKEEFVNWLEAALIRRGISKANLARKTNVTRQAVGHWLKSGHISIETLRKVEEALGEPSPLSLSVNTTLFQIDNLDPCVVSQRLIKDIPLVTWLEAGKVSLTGWTGNTVGVCDLPGTHLYALEIRRSKEMSDLFNAGDILYVDDRPPVNGDHVICRLIDDKGNIDSEAVMRVYKKTRGLVSLTCDSPNNVDYKNLLDENFTMHGVVIGKFSKFD
tara:strand:+ start:1885 stop:2556 length:672 start_codon:yes stop_codon:yes gene_type:complete